MAGVTAGKDRWGSSEGLHGGVQCIIRSCAKDVNEALAWRMSQRVCWGCKLSCVLQPRNPLKGESTSGCMRCKRCTCFHSSMRAVQALLSQQYACGTDRQTTRKVRTPLCGHQAPPLLAKSGFAVQPFQSSCHACVPFFITITLSIRMKQTECPG